MAKYVYPAIFTPEENGQFSVRFPDIENCFTGGDDLVGAMDMAKDVLCLMLYDLEETGQTIPPASSLGSVQTGPDEFASLVACDTVEYRKLRDNRAVKKTLSIPAWLNAMAERDGINFSGVLQEALKQKLNI